MGLKLTKAGHELLLRTMAGDAEMKFLSIQLGNGADAGEDAVGLSNPLLDLEITDCKNNGTVLTLEAAYSSRDVEVGFAATEMGVLVEDPDVAGNAVLYAYQFTPENSADRVRGSQDAAVQNQLCVDVYVGDAESVVVVLAESGGNVTREEFETFTARRDNPHGVTAEQVGLGEVQNAAPEGMKVKIANVPPTDEIINFSSGETLGMILGKIRVAINRLKQHLSVKNPHKLTAKDVQAAEEEHEHSTNDITTGTLGIPRGGTGGKTEREARENLGFRSGACRIEMTAGQIAMVEVAFATPCAEGTYPNVVLTPMLGTVKDLQIGIQSRSSAGFTVFAYSPSFSGDVTMCWIACL